eukprot:g2581.t1
MHQSEWFLEKELPKRYVGTSTCFRKEAGNTTQDLGGLYRVHQFEKVEQFAVCMEEDADKIHHEFLNNAEMFLQSLNIPYRVVIVNGVNLSPACSLKYDIEAWFPHAKQYREVVSCSNCTDYQARALDIRCGAKKMLDGGKKFYAHMINGTLCACQRLICAILENYQCQDCVEIPKVLQPYMYGKTKIPFISNIQEYNLDKKNASKAMRTAGRKKDQFIAELSLHSRRSGTGSHVTSSKTKTLSTAGNVRDTSNKRNRSKKKAKQMNDDKDTMDLFSKEGMSWLNDRLENQSYILGKNGYVASAEDAVVYNALNQFQSILFNSQGNNDYKHIKRWYRNVKSALKQERNHWPATKEHVMSGRHSYFFNLQLPSYLKQIKNYELSLSGRGKTV